MPYNPKSKLNLKPFVKGDPRINRAGVPADAIAARRFVQELGAEIIKTGDGDMTRYYAMLRLMFNSKQPKDREILLKIMGHLKDEIDINANVNHSWKEFINGDDTDPA